MRFWVRAALVASAALTLSACGGSGGGSSTRSTASTPSTGSLTTNTPTSTIAVPTATPYIGPNGLPMETGDFLAASTTTRLGAIVDGIQCEPLAQLAYRTYAHLQVFVHGHSRALPGGIGIVDEKPIETPHGLFYAARTCMYWLHTRAADGLVEAESPVARTFTLGDLFAVWNQPLTSTHVARFHGPVTATVNGRRWNGSPARIPIRQHSVIQLSVGRPVRAFRPVDWVGINL